MADIEEIEVGDIVSIKHGQIMMIAEGVDFKDTICVWYDIDHKLQREKIKTEILVKHEPEEYDDRN